ncbi:MAG: hypothetical protein ACKV2T_08220 [Kofleriaceae bacterium]
MSTKKSNAASDKPPRSDFVVLVQVALVVVGLAIVINLMSCQKTDAEKVPEPHKDLVLAMTDYCRVGDLPRDKWREAQRAWGFQNGGNPNVMNMWNRAARDKHPIAIKVVRRAADLGVGPDKCPILDILDRPERVPPNPAADPNGSAAPANPSGAMDGSAANPPAAKDGSAAPASANPPP